MKDVVDPTKATDDPLAGMRAGGRDRSIPAAGHAFFDDQRGAYVASAATDAWHRTMVFFHRWLAQ